MVFSSLIFVFAFLFPSLLVYWIVPPKWRNGVLLISSLIFYAWGGLQYVLLLLFEAAISWFCALKIAHHRKQKRNYMILEVICLLGLLGIFKYLGFVLSNVQFFTGWPGEIPQIVLPLGISFYTFQLLSYVLDVYNGQVKAQSKYWKLLLYCSLFHQCIAGPIVRYSTVAYEIDHRHVTIGDLTKGIRRFSIGLAKKAILANGCALIANNALPSVANQPFLAYWLSMLAFMLQLYLDFSAYSDMAIGMGWMVGFHYLENFNYPYQAKSVQDFWRRWHISLSTFFRDYVYIPLGGSRAGPWIYIRNMVTVWFLTGLWHGASWNFIFWGLYYLVFLLLERFVIQERIPKGWNIVYTLSVVFIGTTIFRFENLDELWTVLKGLIGIGISGFSSAAVIGVLVSNLFLLIASIIGCTEFSVYIRRIFAALSRQNKVIWVLYLIEEALLPVLLLILSTLALVGNAYNPFLYFQF